MTKLKPVKRILASIALCVSLSSHAATVDVLATAELTDVSTTGSASISIDGGFFFGDAIVNDVSDFSASDRYIGLRPGSASADSGAGGGTASALAEAGIASGSAGAGAMNVGNALASSLSEMGFELDGAGDVTLTFEATLSIGLVDTTGLEFANAVVTLTDSFGSYVDAFMFGDGLLGDDSQLIETTLVLNYAVDGYATGWFSVETAAFAETGLTPVPVPAAAWLFASGLVGLAGLCRRRPS